MQSHQPAFKERTDGQLTPSVIIRIADNKARQQKEKVYGKIAVVDDLVQRTGGMSLENVENNYDNGSNATQTIEYRIMRFGVKRVHDKI
jgi:hypothetical protein